MAAAQIIPLHLMMRRGRIRGTGDMAGRYQDEGMGMGQEVEGGLMTRMGGLRTRVEGGMEIQMEEKETLLGSVNLLGGAMAGPV